MTTAVEILCKGLPVEFSTYMNYCRSLRFEDKPDYGYLRKMFKELFLRENYEWDFVYDWCLPISGQKIHEYSNGKVIVKVNTNPLQQSSNPPITLQINEKVLEKSMIEQGKGNVSANLINNSMIKNDDLDNTE